MNLTSKLKNNSLVNASIVYILGGFLLKGIGFITAPIFIRLLSVNEYGIVSIYNTWLSLLVIVFTLQIGSSLIPAKRDYKGEEFEKYLSSILTLLTISSIVAMLLVLIFLNQISYITKLDNIVIIIMVISIFFVGNINFASSLSIKEENRKKYLKISFANIIISTVLSIVFIIMMDDKRYYGRILGMFFGSVIVGGVSYFKIINKTGFRIDKEHYKYCLNISLPMIFHVISTTILSQSDRIMINNIVGSGEAGIYSFVYNIGTILLIITGATNNAWVPWYQKNMMKNNNKQIQCNIKKYILAITGIASLIMLLSPEILKVLSTREYWKGIDVLPILVLGSYISYLYTFAINYEIYMKKTKIIGISTTIVAALNVYLNYILIPKYQAVGAAIATLVSYVLLFIVHQFNVRKLMNHKEVKFSVYLLGISFMVIIVVLSYIFKNNFWIRVTIYIVLLLFILIKIANKINNNKILVK